MKSFIYYFCSFYWSKKLAKYHCKFSAGISSLSSHSQLTIESHVIIGSFCSIANNAVLGLEKDKHPSDWPSTPLFTKVLQYLFVNGEEINAFRSASDSAHKVDYYLKPRKEKDNCKQRTRNIFKLTHTASASGHNVKPI